MATLEERVERLETFAGDIDKIVSVYANSVQEICDKYLNLLYIEEYDSNHPNYLNIDGFLSELTSVADLPKNVMFNIRASHNFAYDGSDHSSKLRLKRTNPDTHQTVMLDVPLKKYDVENPGNLVFLEPDDFLSGMLYGVYINSQNIAVISSNDSGALALQEVTQLSATVTALAAVVEQMTSTQTVGTIAVTTGTIGTLTVSTALMVTNAFNLPTGTTCSTPQNDTDVANKAFVVNTINAAINNYHSTYHLFGTADPSTVLNPTTVPERAIYYKY